MQTGRGRAFSRGAVGGLLFWFGASEETATDIGGLVLNDPLHANDPRHIIEAMCIRNGCFPEMTSPCYHPPNLQDVRHGSFPEWNPSFFGLKSLTLLPQRETRFQFSQYLGGWGVRGSLESMVSGWWKFFPKKSSRDVLGGGFKYFLFSPLPGEMIQFDFCFSTGLKPPTSVFFIVCTPEDWRIEPEHDGTGKMIFRNSRGIFSGSMFIFRGVCVFFWSIWSYCWWFRNPKQPPGMYKTL